MKIYIAGTFENRYEYIKLADKIAANGHEVVSKWLFEPLAHDDYAAALALPDTQKSTKAIVVYRECAERDLENIKSCDVFVLINDGKPGRGGKWFEAGYAYALGKSVRVVGKGSNVFCWLPDIGCDHDDIYKPGKGEL